MERQAIEIDPSAEFKVIWQRNSMTVDQYFRRFSWDDAKYPRSRQLRDTVDMIVSSIQKLDDEMRIRSAALNEVKQSHSATAKREGIPLAQRDMVDILTPDIVSKGDFVDTENLTTAVAIVPRSLEPQWLECYEELSPNVVPRSAKKFDFSDRDGNSLWRVVLFRKNLEEFKMAAKTKRFIVREFSFSESSYRSRVAERSRLEAERMRQETFLSRICFAAFSDVLIALTHLKAMRLFVEAVLRYGVPPKFAAFILRPASPAKEKKLRKELMDVLASQRGYTEGAGDGLADVTGETDEEFYPYVSLTLVPLVLAIQK
eukprot:GHVO01046182.1.p1 GENE.GHVO01046182.1~~GHVO01046182.1.p1  ORF type:complete len:316 (+),score=46.12 GHVO01046182.1:184-1131(+)